MQNNNNPKEHSGGICGEAGQSALFMFNYDSTSLGAFSERKDAGALMQAEGEAPALTRIYAMTYMHELSL